MRLVASQPRLAAIQRRAPTDRRKGLLLAATHLTAGQRKQIFVRCTK